MTQKVWRVPQWLMLKRSLVSLGPAAQEITIFLTGLTKFTGFFLGGYFIFNHGRDGNHGRFSWDDTPILSAKYAKIAKGRLGLWA